jgi:hypothetical protein
LVHNTSNNMPWFLLILSQSRDALSPAPVKSGGKLPATISTFFIFSHHPFLLLTK